jgi:hypothetical protein
LSSQKLGAPISASSTASRASLAAMSKMPPQLVDAALEIAHVALELAEH